MTTFIMRNTSCSKPSFVESQTYIQIVTHSVSIISIPLSFYVLYCIVYLTPQSMRGAKKHLLILQVWTMIFDIVFNLLNAPVVFLPSVSFVMLGYGYDIGIPSRFQFYLIQALCCVIPVATIGLFENRFSSIVTNPYRIEKSWIRFLLHLFNYFVAFTIVIPPYLGDVDTNRKRMELSNISPCVPDEVLTPRFAVVTDKPTYITIFMFSQLMIVLPQTLFFANYTSYLLVYHLKKTVSESTRKLQKKFLSSLFLQITIPYILLLIPVLYIWFSTWTSYYNAAYNNHIVALVSMHGLCATMCTLVIHKPYRAHLFSMINLKRFK